MIKKTVVLFSAVHHSKNNPSPFPHHWLTLPNSLPWGLFLFVTIISGEKGTDSAPYDIFPFVNSNLGGLHSQAPW